MSWTASSSAYVLQDEELANVFAQAAQFVINETGTVDPGLSHGWLYCSACRDVMLLICESTPCEIGTAWFDAGMSRQAVKRLSEVVQWDRYIGVFKGTEPDASDWAYWSVRKFVETCAQLNLRIKFDIDLF